ncbi:MAG: phospholipase D-like domain-containing protein [Deltaproteobacteria bacterium]
MRAILDPGRNCWKSARADLSGVLVDAAAYYRAFYAAASQAKKSIILSGWQFDRGVPLVRGQDAPPGAEVRLLAFLDQLCEHNPELEVYILAWDFNVVFALEREWMQTLYFQWATNKRLQFRFDEAHAAQGSHHQKFAVIDRSLSFLGGMDLCEARWDDRRHQQDNPLRVSRGEPAKPYHDVQAYLVGCRAADTLRELFVDRWAHSEGPQLVLPECESAAASSPYCPPGALALGAYEVAFSRTDPRGPNDDVREVEALLMDAIRAAERLIYIETQYFSSRAVGDALISRMRESGRARLQLVVILNDKPEAVKEEIAIGLRQAKIMSRLARVAKETGHALGAYGTLCEGEARERPATYIHSKMLIVDDRFLTVGSANLTNRSMGVDTELNVSWEAPEGRTADDPLVEGIRNLRVSLLAEHTGLAEAAAEQRAAADLGNMEGLVARLDELSSSENARLTRHIMASQLERQVMKVIDPEALPFDPARADYETDSDAEAPEPDAEPHSRSLFIGGLSALWDRLKPS